MATRWSDEHVAATLNRMTFTTGQGNTWTARRVVEVRRSHGIAAYESAHKGGEWLTQIEVAHHLGINVHVVRRMMVEGVIPAVQVMKCAPWQIRRADLEAKSVIEAVQRAKNGPCRESVAEQESLFTCLSRRDSQ
jgi:hypothetical protein